MSHAVAQTFTQRIQKQEPNKATVTIHQDPAIDELVNTTVLPPANNSATTASNTPSASSSLSSSSTSSTSSTSTSKTTPAAKPSAGNNQEQRTEDVEAPDLSKKVIRGGQKVPGYRVQAFAGGNSRADRQKAEQVGNSIKAIYPTVPVYVHFYSPRWICRVGNYRTYEEAHQMLVNLRNMGYTQASIVKGKITVQ